MLLVAAAPSLTSYHPHKHSISLCLLVFAQSQISLGACGVFLRRYLRADPDLTPNPSPSKRGAYYINQQTPSVTFSATFYEDRFF